jgi:hypothetical protein
LACHHIKEKGVNHISSFHCNTIYLPKMVATRSSPQSDSSSPASPCQTEPVLGDKRKAGASLTQNSKAGQNGAEKKQKTLEETIGQFGNDYRHNQDRDASKHYDGSHASTATSQTRKELPVDSVKDDPEESQLGKSDNVDISGDTNNELKQKPSAKDGEVHEAVDATAREQTTPDSILEKGLIYFFFRGRVGIEDPSNTNEIARSYIVIRPIPHGASLKQASVDTNVPSYRVLALPKKVLPTTPRDRFMVFVDYAKITADEIKDNVLKSSDYATQTAGTRHQPSATPIASGVYAFTTTGRETHLAYMLTLTDGGPNEVQKDVGLREKGSFVVSVKNPQYEGPTGTNLPKGPDFPQE